MNLSGRQKTKSEQETGAYASNGEIFNIPPYLIRPNPFLSRTQFTDTSLCSLADSIRRYGMLQPLGVCLSKDGKYELVAGERRLRAALILGLSTVPCVIVGSTERDAEYLSVVENIQREGLNMFDQARAIKRLVERDKISTSGVAELLSVGESEISKMLSLTRFTRAEMQEILCLGLSQEIAYILTDVPVSARYYTVKICAEKGLSKKEVQWLSDKIKSIENPSPDDVERLLLNFREKKEDAVQREEKAEEKKNSRRNHKIVLRDISVLERSLEKNCDILCRAGFGARLEKKEEQGEVLYIIRVKKTQSN